MSQGRIAIVGAGWAGLAAAVRATQRRQDVTLFEAARTAGGRARALPLALPDGRRVTLDNGQHILIGAYGETLRLMRAVGLDPHAVLQRQPLALVFPDGHGLSLPDWPVPLDALAGILRARGWPWRDRFALLRTAGAWRRSGFRCAAETSVADLCATLTDRLRRDFIDPLCVSALNTPADRASGQVFLRVLQDALFGPGAEGWGASNLLLPRQDLGALLPDAALRWLGERQARWQPGRRVRAVQPAETGWFVDGEHFDRVVLACAPGEAARLVEAGTPAARPATARAMQAWAASARTLTFEAIATVYALAAPGTRLARPMLALRPQAQKPAQFVFDRGQLGGPDGLLAFVVSASPTDRDALQTQVLAQAREQLGLELEQVRTVVEKRATFACTPALERPVQTIAPGLTACGDWCEGPYPATLEGAVRSGLSAIDPGEPWPDRRT